MIGEYIIYIIANLFNIYVIYRFTNIFFVKQNVNRRKELISFIILYIVSTIINILFEEPILNLFVVNIGIFLITSLYKERLIKRILTIILIYSVLLLVDAVVASIVIGFNIKDILIITTSPIVVLIELIIELIIESKFSSNLNKEVPKKYGMVLIIVPIISIINAVYIFYTEYININVLVVFHVTLLIINMTTFVLYDWIIESYSQKYERDLLKRELESYTNQVALMKQSQEQVNSVKHDMKHHILAINHMAKENRADDILKYINIIHKEIDNPNEYIISGNEVVDTILNYMISEAKKLTNNIEVDIKVPSDINLNRFNINIILGNLLQNSLRALEEVENGELRIFIEYNKCIMYIDIENSYSGNLKMNGDKYISTKKDSELHGIGLENVKKIVEKHNGEINISNLDNIFKVNIMMYV